MKGTLRAAIAALAAALMLWSGCALAAYPEKSVWMVVPYPPGGSADALARVLARELAARLQQPVIIDNKGGANGAIGAEQVTRAAPDGYTIMLDNMNQIVNSALRPMRFDPQKELVPIMQVSDMWLILVAPAKAPYNTFAEFVEYARRNPARVSYGTIGSAGQMVGEQFKSLAKIDMLHVPYKGGGPGVVAAMAGEVSVMFGSGGSGLAAIRAGRLKALAVAAPSRYAALPDVPTFKELGYPDIVMSDWMGLFAPKGTPPAVVRRLNQEVAAILADPKVRDSVTGSLGIDIHASNPSEFTEFYRHEAARFQQAVKQFNLRAD